MTERYEMDERKRGLGDWKVMNMAVKTEDKQTPPVLCRSLMQPPVYMDLPSVCVCVCLVCRMEEGVDKRSTEHQTV